MIRDTEKYVYLTVGLPVVGIFDGLLVEINPNIITLH